MSGIEGNKKMKTVFHKNFYFLLTNTILFTSFSILLIYFNIYFRISYSNMGYAVYWFWASQLILLFSFVEPVIFRRKRNLSKVFIDETGIRLMFKEEILESHQWTDIEDVIKASMIRHQELKFTLKTKSDGYNNDVMYFNVDRKIKKALLFYCSNEEIHGKVKSIKLLY